MEFVDGLGSEIDDVIDCPVRGIADKRGLAELARGRSQSIDGIETKIGAAAEEGAKLSKILVHAIGLLVRVTRELAGKPVIVSGAGRRITIRRREVAGCDAYFCQTREPALRNACHVRYAAAVATGKGQPRRWVRDGGGEE